MSKLSRRIRGLVLASALVPAMAACSLPGAGPGAPQVSNVNELSSKRGLDPAEGPIGWAAMAGGTTGGAGGATVTVDDVAELDAALRRTEPLVIRIDGVIRMSGMHDVESNKTIVGVGADSGITGGGLDMSSVHNIIVRDLNFSDADDDSINIQQFSHHIWIDHNDLSNAQDGLIDVKRGSDFITVSWNHTFDNSKTMLLGHSDDNAEQDVGHLRVTYHHNFFDGSDTRHPRVRFGNPVHVFNNYYRNNDYGVASTMDAGVLVEGNYFESVEDPTLVGYADSEPGSLVTRKNVYVDSGQPESVGSVKPVPYEYTLDDAREVEAVVSAGAGPRE